MSKKILYFSLMVQMICISQTFGMMVYGKKTTLRKPFFYRSHKQFLPPANQVKRLISNHSDTRDTKLHPVNAPIKRKSLWQRLKDFFNTPITFTSKSAVVETISIHDLQPGDLSRVTDLWFQYVLIQATTGIDTITFLRFLPLFDAHPKVLRLLEDLHTKKEKLQAINHMINKTLIPVSVRSEKEKHAIALVNEIKDLRYQLNAILSEWKANENLTEQQIKMQMKKDFQRMRVKK